MLFPWQQTVWKQLWSARQAGRLPHALLLSAAVGSGLEAFGACLSGAMLCMAVKTDGTACGACQSCTLLSLGSHPDFIAVVPEEEGAPIRTDQIRALGEFLANSGQYSAVRIAVMEPADRLNRHAANSLLKTLEEPPLGCLLILLSTNPMALPVTIRSRCQHFRFSRTADAAKLAWLGTQITSGDPGLLLALAGNAPLAAVDLAGSTELAERARLLGDLEALAQGRADPIVVAGRWSDLEFPLVSRWLLKLLEDAIRLSFDAASPTVANKDLVPRLLGSIRTQPVSRLFAARDLLLEDQRLLLMSTGLTPLNFYEELTMTWVGTASPH
jgi:DNA polymerase III subunit delta'